MAFWIYPNCPRTNTGHLRMSFEIVYCILKIMTVDQKVIAFETHLILALSKSPCFQGIGANPQVRFIDDNRYNIRISSRILE